MDLLAIGTIRTSWGVKGWLKLSSYSGEWSHFVPLKTVELKASGSEVTRKYQVEGFRMHQGVGMFKLSGVDTPESGKNLAGREIMVPRECAAPLYDDEWYLSDLVGLSLVDGEGRIYGEITGIIESADDLLEILRPEGGVFIVPFRSEFVGKPDLKSGQLLLNAPWLAE